MNEKVKSEITCSLCYDIFKDPVILNCCHSFCLSCAENLLTHSRGYTLSCPLCRAPSTIPVNNGVAQFKKNFTLKNLIIELTEKSEIKDQICDNCAVEKAAITCQECAEDMCTLCHTSVHSRGRRKEHHILPLASDSCKCEMHRREIEFLCTTDQVLVCVDCVLRGSHFGHQCVAVRPTLKAFQQLRKNPRKLRLMNVDFLSSSSSTPLSPLTIAPTPSPVNNSDFHFPTISTPLYDQVGGLTRSIGTVSRLPAKVSPNYHYMNPSSTPSSPAVRDDGLINFSESPKSLTRQVSASSSFSTSSTLSFFASASASSSSSSSSSSSASTSSSTSSSICSTPSATTLVSPAHSLRSSSLFSVSEETSPSIPMCDLTLSPSRPDTSPPRSSVSVFFPAPSPTSASTGITPTWGRSKSEQLPSKDQKQGTLSVRRGREFGDIRNIPLKQPRMEYHDGKDRESPSVDSGIEPKFLQKTNEKIEAETHKAALQFWRSFAGDKDEIEAGILERELNRHFTANALRDMEKIRELSKEDMSAIMLKMQRDGKEGSKVSFNSFRSRWHWFITLEKVIQKIGYVWWREDPLLCQGIISRTTSEQLLQGQLSGTFILRFSESQAGFIAVDYVHSRRGIVHTLVDATGEGFKSFERIQEKNIEREYDTLPQLIMSLPFFRFVYPKIDKKDVFNV